MADDKVIYSEAPFCLPTFLSGAVVFPVRTVVALWVGTCFGKQQQNFKVKK